MFDPLLLPLQFRPSRDMLLKIQTAVNIYIHKGAIKHVIGAGRSLHQYTQQT
jgi:hypothetical protein